MNQTYVPPRNSDYGK